MVVCSLIGIRYHHVSRPCFLTSLLKAAALLLFWCDYICAQQDLAAVHAGKGLQLAQAGDLQSAESELRKAATLAPDNPEFLANLATVLAMEKKLDDSTVFFQRALKNDPSNLTARRYLAANLWQLHRYSDAKKNLEVILKAKPNDVPSRLLLGMVAENMQDYTTAAKMLSSVPGEVQKQPESIAALAVSYYHLGEKEKARRILYELKNHSAGTRAVLLGAQIADQAADYDTAEQMLNSLVSVSPSDTNLRYQLAAIQYHAGEFDQSEQTLAQLIGSGTKTGPIFNLLGWCYQKQNRTEDALHAFEDGIGAQPDHESNYLDLQKVLLASNRVSAALEIAKKTTDALPNSARAFAMRGAIEMQASQFSNAVASYRRAAELDTSSADAALGLADAEFSADMKTDAYATFTEGIQKFSKDARFPLHYALTLVKESETGGSHAGTRAQELLKSAVKLDPNFAETHYQLGELALKQGRAEDALREYQAAAKLDPHEAKIHFGLSKAYRRLGKTIEAKRETQLFERLHQTQPTSAATVPSPDTSN